MTAFQGVYKNLTLDGLWIDMNEPSNYCTGDVCWNDGAHLPRCRHPTQEDGVHALFSRAGSTIGK